MTASCARACITERQLAADQRTQCAVGQPGAETGMNPGEINGGEVEQHHAEDRRFAPHHAARVDFDASAIADQHDAATPREQRDVLVQVDVRVHLEDDVDTASVGGLGHLLDVLRVAVVDDDIRAGVLHRLQCRGRCRRCR